jgi:hypothetical protein
VSSESAPIEINLRGVMRRSFLSHRLTARATPTSDDVFAPRNPSQDSQVPTISLRLVRRPCQLDAFVSSWRLRGSPSSRFTGAGADFEVAFLLLFSYGGGLTGRM